MKKTLRNILLSGMTAAALTFSSCSPDDIDEPTPNPPTPITNKAPTAYGEVTGGINNSHGTITDAFTFDGSNSTDPENKPMTSRWDYDGDGVWDTNYAPVNTNLSGTLEAGNYDPILEVKDDKGLTSKDYLPKLGILDPDNNPISIETIGPAYAEVGENTIFNIDAEENNGRPLNYDVDFGQGWINSGETINKNYDTVGMKSLETRATSDYNISNTTEDEVNIGPEKAYTKWMTDKADGKKYKFAYSDGILISVDDFQGMTSNYEGKTQEAPFYENDSIKYSMSFGKLYSRDDVNKGLSDRIFISDNTGIEYTAHVTTEAEYDKMIDAYGGYNIAGKEMKYNGFDSNGNNSSRMAMMLGGNYYNGEFVWLGSGGQYFTGTDHGDGTNVTVYTTKETNAAKKNLRNGVYRAAVKYTIEQ